MKFTTTKRFNACELCGDTSGKCRTTQEDLLLCMTLADGENVPGFRYLGITKDGLWGKFVRDKQNWSKSERDAHQKRLAEKRQKELEAKARSRSNALSEADRDKAIRDIAKFIGLYPRHKEALKARGLTDEQISQGLFFSVAPGQKLPNQTPDNLPGVNIGRDGSKYLATSVKGFACVAFNSQGQAIGWQIRNENPEADNKYRWAKGIFSSHLKSGELPITVVGNGSSIGLCEGILKPYIAAHKHGLKMIGAAGGNFSGSPKQFKQALGNAREVTIFPDAGDIINPHTYRRWCSQIKFLSKLNLEIKIAWWGQITKDYDDIDELENLDQIQYLTPQEWRKLAYQIKQEYQLHDDWLKSKKFTPDITIEQEWLTLETLPENSIIAINSGLGTGKTTEIIRQIKIINESLPDIERWLNCGYRNSLQIQFCEKSGFSFIHDHKVIPRDIEGKLKNFACAINSLYRLNDEDFDGINLIIDEVVSVLKHLLFSGTLKKIRAVIIAKFEQLIRRSNRIILADGNLTDWAVEFVSQFAPDKKVVKILNTYSQQKPVINWLNGAYDLGGKLKERDKTELLELLSQAKLPVIVSDSQKFLEAIEKLLLKEGKDCLRIDSKTIAKKYFGRDCNLLYSEAELFIKNPVEYINNKPPFILLFNTSAESGLDVNIPNHFTEMFGFFFGVVDVDTYLQMIARIRDTIPRYLWVNPQPLPNEKYYLSSPSADEIRNYQNEMIDNSLVNIDGNHSELIIEKIKTILSSKTCQTEILVQASINYEKKNLRKCLKEALMSKGYEVREFVGGNFAAQQEAYKNASDEVIEQDSELIFKADYLPQDTNLDTIEQGTGLGLQWHRLDATPKTPDRVGVLNLRLRKRLPGIEKTELWSKEFVKEVVFKDRNIISRWENLFLFLNPVVLPRLNEANFFNFVKDDSKTLDINLKPVFIKTLHEIGLPELLEREYNQDDPVAIAVFNKVKQSKSIQRRLGLYVGNKTICQYLGLLWAKLGLKASSSGRGRNKKYFVQLEERDKQILGLIVKRYEKYLASDFNVDWASLDVNKQKLLTIISPEQTSLEAAPDKALTCSHNSQQNIYKLPSCVSVDGLFGMIDRFSPRDTNIERLIAACRQAPEGVLRRFLHQARVLFPGVAQKLMEAIP